MAKRHASALKQGRQALKRRTRNRAAMSNLKTVLRRFETAIANKKTDDIRQIFNQTISAVDRASSKRIIHPNKAAREVSHLTLKVNKILAPEKSA